MAALAATGACKSDGGDAAGTGSSGAQTGDGSGATTVPDPSGLGTTEPGDGGDPSGAMGDGCCEPHSNPGCNEAPVEQCVCREDASCCVFGWDTNCVNAALGPCDATCMPVATTTDPGDTTSAVDDTAGTDSTGVADTGMIPGGSCCNTHGPGCDVPAIETCVCGMDSFCCNMFWDQKCVAIAENSCNAAC